MPSNRRPSARSSLVPFLAITALATLGAGFISSSRPTSLSQNASILDDSESARTIVEGRVLNIEPLLSCNSAAGEAEPTGATVRLSTNDGRGLPAITAVQLQLTVRRQPVWTTALQLTGHSRFREDAQVWTAANGPTLAPGTLTATRIQVFTPRRYSTLDIPVTINEGY